MNKYTAVFNTLSNLYKSCSVQCLGWLNSGTIRSLFSFSFLLFFIRFHNLSARLWFKGHPGLPVLQHRWLRQKEEESTSTDSEGTQKKKVVQVLLTNGNNIVWMLSWPQTSPSNCKLLRKEWKSTVRIFVTHITGWILMFCGTCSMTSEQMLPFGFKHIFVQSTISLNKVC